MSGLLQCPGEIGPEGPQGPQGATGAKGDKGDTGPPGTTLHSALTDKEIAGVIDHANESVTYAKIQKVSATNKLLGRESALAGIIEEIACTAAGRALIDDADAAAQRTTLGALVSTNPSVSGKLTVNQAEAADIIDFQDNNVSVLKIYDGGILDLPKQSNVIAYRATTNQAITRITWTKVQLNAEILDVQNEFDSSTNYRFTATKAGVYAIMQKGRLDSMADGNQVLVDIYKNGTRLFNTQEYILGGAGATSVCGQAIVDLVANDYIEFYIYHNYGTGTDTRNLSYNLSYTYFVISKIA